MPSFHYFAYGSNMLTARLAARCPSARAIGPATVSNYALHFSKRGRDLTGKATLVTRPGASRCGVLFELDQRELAALDDAEGKGYERRDNLEITLISDGSALSATTYIARDIAYGLKPFDWYLALVIAGAMEHRLPADQIAAFRQVKYDIDADIGRPGRKAALEALALSGFGAAAEILKS